MYVCHYFKLVLTEPSEFESHSSSSSSSNSNSGSGLSCNTTSMEGVNPYFIISLCESSVASQWLLLVMTHLSLPWFSNSATQVIKEWGKSGGKFSGRPSAVSCERVATRQEIKQECNSLLRVSSMDGKYLNIPIIMKLYHILPTPQPHQVICIAPHSKRVAWSCPP